MRISRCTVVEYDLDGLTVPVAALADIIRSREAADQPEGSGCLPTLRALLGRLSRPPS
jgi:hypothetical protein